MRFKCEECGRLKNISDEDIQKILDMHEEQKKEKEKNANALQEVAKAAAVLEQQLKTLKVSVRGLEDKIKESDIQIDEEIIIS